jgi:hypothetical protein
MSGFSNDNASLANGLPARHIGPETGSSGNAAVTNTGGTSEGTNEAADARPAGASGLDRPVETGTGEARSFVTPRPDIHRFQAQSPLSNTTGETAAQRIADGEDRIRRDPDAP